MLQKGVYPYEYMDDWEKINETLLPEKEKFYSHLNIEDITDAHYTHTKRVCKEFRRISWFDTLNLVDVFEDFRNMCLRIYELDPVILFSAPGLAWQAALRKL